MCLLGSAVSLAFVEFFFKVLDAQNNTFSCVSLSSDYVSRGFCFSHCFLVLSMDLDV